MRNFPSGAGRRLQALACLWLGLVAIGPVGWSAETPSRSTWENLVGETCQSAARADIPPDPEAPSPVNLLCAGNATISGTLAITLMPLGLPSDEAARHHLIEQAASASPAGHAAAQRMACREGHWETTESGQELFLRTCALIDGNWPHLAVVAPMGRYLVLAETLPALLPVAAGVATHLLPDAGAPWFGDAAAARTLLDRVYGGAPPLVGSADLATFATLAQAARLQSSRSDFRAAEDAYRGALLIEEKAQGADSPGVGTTLMELALAVSNQRRFEESAALFRRADPIIQRSPNQADQARYNTYLAYDAANAGRFQDALAYAREASSAWREMAESGGDLESLGGDDSRSTQRGELAHSLNLQAAMALRTGDLAEAEADAKEALGIVGADASLPPWWRPEILVTIGQVYAGLGRLTEAEASFRGALVYQQRLFGDSGPTATTLLGLSAIYADEGLYGDSVRAYDFAMKILASDELARSHVVVDQVAPLLGSASALIEKVPERGSEMEAKIFQAIQLLSAGVADQTIAKASARLANGDPAVQALVRGVQEAERQRDAARIELAHETSLPDEERGAAKESALLAEVNRWTAERGALLDKLDAAYPAYAGLTRPQTVGLSDLQGALRPREALLVFEIGRSKAYAVLVTAHHVIARPLDIDGERIDNQVRELRKAFTIRAGRVGEYDLAAAYALYRTLFGPLEQDLGDIDRLAVVSGGALSSLPVSLLVTRKPPADGDYTHAAWLAQRFATADVPSIRAFVDLRTRAVRQGASHAFLGIGNPSFVGDAGAKPGDSLAALGSQCRQDGPMPPALLRALTPLPETADEVKTVARALGADAGALLLGAEATESALRARDLSDVRVLYFATHGLLPGELSCQTEPALALSPPASAAPDKASDGLLEASEIAGLKLNADLVVLSACNTAQSTSGFGGEALSGLAESFFYAGARGLVASHWEVPSAATARLMVGVFQRLTADPTLPTAEALRLSQVALLGQRETAHPFYWASFTIIGDGGVLPSHLQAAGDAAAGRL